MSEPIEIDATAAWQAIKEGAACVDVRQPHEHLAGSIPGTIRLPLGQLIAGDTRPAIDPANPVVVYCAQGQRSLLAAQTLVARGYRAVSLAGGVASWQAAELPWEPGDVMPVDTTRYARHLTLPEVGHQGQQRIGNATVLVVGAGGLGSPAALYLAAAGLGRLVIVDDDEVDLSNLQRQVIHDTRRIGMGKADSAEQTIDNLNPHVQVEAHRIRLTIDTADQLLDDVDVVVDGTDDFDTRYVINDASVLHQVPVVHGSVIRFEGQVSVFDPRTGPCYRCLYPHPPAPGVAMSCAVAGVLGVVPGVIGTLQATEALKLILGIGDPLRGRLLTYDALEPAFRVFPFDRDPNCPACEPS